MLTVQVQGLSLNSGAVVENSCTIWASIGVKGLIWEECGKQGICGILLTSFGPQIYIWVKVEIPQRKLAETRSKGQSLSQLGWTGLAPGPAEDRNEHQEPGLKPCCQAVQTPGVSHGGCSPVPGSSPEGAIHPTQRKGAPECFWIPLTAKKETLTALLVLFLS